MKKDKSAEAKPVPHFAVNPVRFFKILFIASLAAFIASVILAGWAETFNESYPDFVRQKLLIYFERLFLVITVLMLAIIVMIYSYRPLRRRLFDLLPDIILVCAALLFALVCAELVARVFYREHFVVFELHGIHRASLDPEIVYELRPGAGLSFYYKDQSEKITYAINSGGLRGKEINERKPDDTLRIITLGDSVTFGVRVDQENIYPARLEERLNLWATEQGIGKKFRVLNPSSCGWNTYNEVSWLERRGFDFEPDIVLLQFSMNDVDDPLAHMGTTVLYHLKEIPRDFFPEDPGMSGRENIFTRTADDIGFREVFQWYAPRLSKLYALTAQVIHGLKVKREAAEGGTVSQPWLSWCLDYLANPDSPHVAWLKNQLERLKRLSDKHGVAVVVVIFPLSYQLNSDNTTWRSALENVKMHIQDAGLDLLDLTPSFEEMSGDNQFHFYLHGDASHLNTKGHEFTAQTIMDFLVAYQPFISRLDQPKPEP